MTHCNIHYPTSEHDHIEQLSQRVAEEKIKTEFYRARAKRFEDDLRSIFERVKDGDEVFLVMEDGSLVYLEMKASVSETGFAPPDEDQDSLPTAAEVRGILSVSEANPEVRK